MTELQAELLLKQAARIEALEERVEKLKAVLREAIPFMGHYPVQAERAREALAPEQDK